jgi:hypothetical protein
MRFQFKIRIYILGIVFGLVHLSCNTDTKPDYFSYIPQISSYDYNAVSTQELESKFVTHSPELFITGDNTQGRFIGTPFWIEYVGDEYWVADPLRGEISSFDQTGSFLRVIANKGNGPGELTYPANIYYANFTANNEDNYVWILDSGTKSIIKINPEYGEEGRIRNELLLSEFYGNRLKLLPNNTFLAPIMNHKDYIIGNIDQSGDFISGLIPRIVPLGYQPITYNRAFFDVDQYDQIFTYAYNGLPLIFIENKSEEVQYVFDFKTEELFTNTNIDLTPRPIEETVSVRSIITDLFVHPPHIYFSIGHNIIVFDFEKKQTEFVIVPTHDDGENMSFQQMVFTNGTFFLINRFTSDIYRFELSDIQK